MSVIVELSIFPMDKGESLSPYVARAVEVIEQSGLAYVFGPMSTSIEGEWDEVMAVVDACYKALEPDCHRILVHFRADCRKGRKQGLKAKVESVQAKMQKE